MIHDLSKSLRAWLNLGDDAQLRQEFKELDKAIVGVACPDGSFQPAAPSTINLFLYDIRENEKLRSSDPLTTRENGTVLVHRPPRRIDCSYLVTAWPVDVAETADGASQLVEHLLLGQALELLSRQETIPTQYLEGTLNPHNQAFPENNPPVPSIAARPNGLQNPGEFWSSLGRPPRASFNLTATLSVPGPQPRGETLVSSTRVHTEPRDDMRETLVGIGGRVLRRSDGLGIPDARVQLDELGRVAITNAAGEFTFARVATGRVLTLRAAAADYESGVASVVAPPDENTSYDLRLRKKE